MKTGLYQHYKGKLYRVLHIATLDDSITSIATLPSFSETVVVYLPLYGTGKVKVRTVSNFTQQVEVEGYVGPRFKYLGEVESVANDGEPLKMEAMN